MDDVSILMACVIVIGSRVLFLERRIRHLENMFTDPDKLASEALGG